MQAARIVTFASSLLLGATTLASAQSATGGSTPGSAPSGSGEQRMHQGEQMKGGERGGGSGNTGVPGASPADDGNRTQDSRTTKTKDR
ncbi:hypothetical protein CIW48_30040 [Methylobacterium sp. P1-11]|nr:hypothetical protein CIW48_30040 [Methylobacterium sp. P1-11]